MRFLNTFPTRGQPRRFKSYRIFNFGGIFNDVITKNDDISKNDYKTWTFILKWKFHVRFYLPTNFTPPALAILILGRGKFTPSDIGCVQTPSEIGLKLTSDYSLNVNSLPHHICPRLCVNGIIKTLIIYYQVNYNNWKENYYIFALTLLAFWGHVLPW